MISSFLISHLGLWTNPAAGHVSLHHRVFKTTVETRRNSWMRQTFVDFWAILLFVNRRRKHDSLEEDSSQVRVWKQAKSLHDEMRQTHQMSLWERLQLISLTVVLQVLLGSQVEPPAACLVWEISWRILSCSTPWRWFYCSPLFLCIPSLLQLCPMTWIIQIFKSLSCWG